MEVRAPFRSLRERQREEDSLQEFVLAREQGVPGRMLRFGQNSEMPGEFEGPVSDGIGPYRSSVSPD